MANRKINELVSRTPSLTDLMLVGDPSSGYSYKCTVNDIALQVEVAVAGNYVTLATAQTISGAKTFSNVLTLTSVANSSVDTDKFLVLTGTNTVNYRTGAEVLSDIGAQAALTNPVTGTGTTNYLAKFTGTSAIGNSLIYDNGTNVGIGTITPDSTTALEIKKTDGYGLFLNYTTNTGAYPNASGLYLLNTTTTGGYAAMIEEKTPVNNAGQYPILISHTLSSGTAQSGMATGIHFGLPNDAGVLQRTQMSIDTVDPAAATYTSRYRFMVRYNNASTAGMYITGTGVGILTIPTVALDVNGEAKFSTINNATTDTDRFLVSDSGVLKYRTGAELLSDIGAQGSLTLTTTGTSGAATLIGNTLNIPNYAPDLSGYVPTSRTLTINGTAYDLSANRSWSVGTVTSVGLSSATSGVTIGSTPITASGTITLAIATASGTQQGLLSSTDWNTFNNKQNALTLTTTGTSGAATLVGSTLNIPQYQGVLTNPVTGTGNTNYIPKFTGTSSIGNSIMQEGTSNIGISMSPNASQGKLQINQALGTSIDGAIRITDNATTSFVFNNTASGVSSIWSSGVLAFGTGNGTFTERMRLDASGNLGLGTSSPSYKLDVVGSGSISARIQNISSTADAYLTTQNTLGSTLFGINATGGYIYNGGALPILFYTSGSERMRLDASGNLGLGVSPSAWAFTALQVKNASFWSSGNDASITANAYYDGSNYRYIASSASSRIYQNSDGSITWSQAPSGTAGNAISFTQAMTLDASGRLGIGTTSPSYKLDVYGGARIENAGEASIIFRNNTWGNFTIGQSAFSLGGGFLSIGAASAIMTFDGTNSRVGIGTTSPSGNLDIISSSNVYQNISTNGNNQSAVLSLYNSTATGDGAALGYNVAMRFGTITGLNAAGFTERMRITSGGGVAINTTQIPYGNVAIKSNGSTTYYGLNVFASSNNNFIVLNHTGTVGVLETEFSTGGSHSDLTFRVGGSERARFTTSGELLINTTTDAGDYKLQVNGNVYQKGNLYIDQTVGGNYITLAHAGTQTWYQRITTANNSSFVLRNDLSGGTTAFTISEAGNAEFAGSIKTAAPSGGTAQPWKLGSVVSSSVTYDQNNYVEVEINGTEYKLALATPS